MNISVADANENPNPSSSKDQLLRQLAFIKQEWKEWVQYRTEPDESFLVRSISRMCWVFSVVKGPRLMFPEELRPLHLILTRCWRTRSV